MPSNHKCSKRYFKRKALRWARSRILQLRRRLRKLRYFYKFYKHKSPQYLFKLVPLRQSPYTARNSENIPLFKTKQLFQKFFFSLSCCRTILTLKFEMLEALVLLKTISSVLSGQPQIMFLNVEIIEELNLLQDRVLALVICANTNSNIIFKIH